MLKKIDKIIALLMSLYLIAILFNKFIGIVTILFSVVLIIKILKEKKIVPIILGILILSILIYNYKISEQYFYLELNILNKYSNIEYLLRMILFMMMLYIYSNKKILKGIYKEFKNYLNVVTISIIIYEIVIFFMFVTRKGFIYRWGMNIFVGLSGSPHGNTYIMILISILIEWIIKEKNNNKYFMLYGIPFISAFMSGARTPVIAMVCLFFGVRLFKNGSSIINKFKISWKRLTVFTFIFSLLLVSSNFLLKSLINSNIIEKFESTSDNGNVLNSRDKIWEGIIDEYKYNFSTKEKLLGNGIYYTVIINKYNVNSEIWGHSDFIDIMVSYGGIMLIVYVMLYLGYFIKLYMWGKRGRLILTFFITMMLLSTFNGVINYSIFIPSIGFWSMFYISLIEKESKDYL